MAQKIIITCAITGAIHTPSMSPHLPVTPDQIAQAAIGAAKAGAAIVHLHARNPETGKPDHSPSAFAAFLPRIKQSSDAVINLTSGCLAQTTAGLSWLPDASSSRSLPWPLGWGATYAWDWRTVYGSDQASWLPATRLKCIALAGSSKVWDWKSQHRPMHVRSCCSRAAIRSVSKDLASDSG
jgi:hypothetical protein